METLVGYEAVRKEGRRGAFVVSSSDGMEGDSCAASGDVVPGEPSRASSGELGAMFGGVGRLQERSNSIRAWHEQVGKSMRPVQRSATGVSGEIWDGARNGAKVGTYDARSCHHDPQRRTRNESGLRGGVEGSQRGRIFEQLALGGGEGGVGELEGGGSS